MIHLTRLNQQPFVLNCDFIEHIEQTPDTVLTLTGGQKFMVRETPDEIIQRVLEFRRQTLSGERHLCHCAGGIEPKGESGIRSESPAVQGARSC